VLLARGQRLELADPDELVEVAERIQELHAIGPALICAAAIASADRDLKRAGSRLEEFEKVTDGAAPEYRFVDIAREVRICLETGRQDIAEHLLTSAEPKTLRDGVHVEAARAMVAEARGDRGAATMYAHVAERLRDYGDPFEEAMAPLASARLSGAASAPERATMLLHGLGVRV